MTTAIETPSDIEHTVEEVAAKLNEKKHTPEEIKAMPLVEKLFHMQQELGNVPKSGRNDNLGYNYLKESDLVDAIIAMCGRYRVLPILYQDTTATVVAQTLTASNKPASATTVTEIYDLINVDDPKEKLSTLLSQEKLTSNGFSVDSGDKSLYKARTGAKKYALSHTFMVNTGNDAEKAGAGDGDPDEKPAGRRQQGGGRGDVQARAAASKAAEDAEPATESQVDLFLSRAKTFKLKIGEVLQALRDGADNQQLTVAAADMPEFVKGMTRGHIKKALVTLQKVIDAKKREAPTETQPAATNGGGTVPTQ